MLFILVPLWMTLVSISNTFPQNYQQPQQIYKQPKDTFGILVLGVPLISDPKETKNPMANAATVTGTTASPVQLDALRRGPQRVRRQDSGVGPGGFQNFGNAQPGHNGFQAATVMPYYMENPSAQFPAGY